MGDKGILIVGSGGLSPTGGGLSIDKCQRVTELKVKHRAKTSGEFETTGPCDAKRMFVVLTSMFHHEHQERTGMLSRYKRLFTSRTMERGASMVEYALLIVLIAIIAFVAVRVAGENVSTAFSSVADGFTTN